MCNKLIISKTKKKPWWTKIKSKYSIGVHLCTYFVAFFLQCICLLLCSDNVFSHFGTVVPEWALAASVTNLMIRWQFCWCVEVCDLYMKYWNCLIDYHLHVSITVTVCIKSCDFIFGIVWDSILTLLCMTFELLMEKWTMFERSEILANGFGSENTKKKIVLLRSRTLYNSRLG